MSDFIFFIFFDSRYLFTVVTFYVNLHHLLLQHCLFVKVKLIHYLYVHIALHYILYYLLPLPVSRGVLAAYCTLYIFSLFSNIIWCSAALITILYPSFTRHPVQLQHLFHFSMDVFDYRASRVVNTEGVFVATSNDSEIGGLFLRLKNVMVSELHLQWDLAFLEQYVAEGMIPRSLRWDVHPQQGESELDTWFKYFNDAGIKFLDFLITRKRIRLSTFDREIKELKDKLLAFKNSAEYNTLSSNLQAHLVKEDKEQRTKKQKKYSRDIGDYKGGEGV